MPLPFLALRCYYDGITTTLFHGVVGGVGQPLLGSHVLPLHEGPAGFICRSGSLCHSFQTDDGSAMTEPAAALAGACRSTRPPSSSARSGLAASAGRQVQEVDTRNSRSNGTTTFDLVMEFIYLDSTQYYLSLSF